jgi:hypothetical protein
MLVDFEIFFVSLPEPPRVLFNRINLPEFMKWNWVATQHTRWVIFLSRLMEKRRMNRLDFKLFKTRCYYHVIWRWWTWTRTWLDDSSDSFEIENDSTATGDVIVSTIIGKEIEAIALPQINVIVLAEASKVFGKGWSAIERKKHETSVFNWIIKMLIVADLPQKCIIIRHDNPLNALQSGVFLYLVENEPQYLQTFLAMSSLGVGNLRGNSRYGIISHITEDPQVNRKLRPWTENHRQAFFMVLLASFYSK